MLEQNNQTRKEITDYGLQSEADADTERTGDQREAAEIETNTRQRNNQRDNDDRVVSQSADRVRRRSCHQPSDSRGGQFPVPCKR